RASSLLNLDDALDPVSAQRGEIRQVAGAEPVAIVGAPILPRAHDRSAALGVDDEDDVRGGDRPRAWREVEQRPAPLGRRPHRLGIWPARQDQYDVRQTTFAQLRGDVNTGDGFEVEREQRMTHAE